jgi:polar amino acid transport system permease protein
MIERVLGYALSPFLLTGAAVTLQITAVAIVAGTIVGLGIALMRLSPFRILRGIGWFYVWFLRGTPLLLQLIFLYDALPSVGILLSPMQTAMIAFTVNQAAYCAEIIRGGILSVKSTQTVAAAAFGMGYWLTLRRVVLPQALRVVLPALGNETTSLLKMTSLAAAVSVSELTQRSEQIVAQNFDFFGVFLGAGILYIVMTSAITIGQNLLEAKFNYERRARGQ